MAPRALFALSVLALSGLLLAGCIGAPDAPTAPPAAPDPPAPLETLSFKGHLRCGVGAPPGALSPCLGENLFPYTIGPGLKTLLVTLVWDASTPFADTLQLYIETAGYGQVTENEDMHRYWAGGVRSGDVVRIDNGTARTIHHDWDALERPTAIQLRVFPGHTLPPTLFIDQTFHVHIAAAYGARAPAGTDPSTTT